MKCCPRPPYQTPPGYWDQPFVLAYDSDALADASNIQALTIPLDRQWGFCNRKIAGADHVVDTVPNGGGVMLYTAGGAQCSTARLTQNVLADCAVVPERYFPPGGQIRFDLFGTLRVTNTVGPAIAYLSQLAFFGVKRRAGERQDVTNYPYRDWPYTYHYAYTFPAGFTSGTAHRRRIIPVNDADLLLYGVNIIDPATAAYPASPFFKLVLYDRFGEALSNVPLLANYVAANADANGVTGNYFSPPVFYPAGSQIVMDLYSLFHAGQLPVGPIHFDFFGLQRRARA